MLGRDAEHGFLFEERPDVIARMSTFLAKQVLMPLGLVPGGGNQHHHHGHHHYGHHDHDHHSHGPGHGNCHWGRTRH